VIRAGLTIVVPAFNESELLPACLRSLAKQDFQGSVEVIVVDNGSTDDTADVAREFGARVVVEHVKGVCPARQRGTESAQGEIIVSTDSDTTFAPDWLRRIDDTFASDPAIVLVGGPVAFVNAAVGQAIQGPVRHQRSSRVDLDDRSTFPPATWPSKWCG
jgi:glycosyltransferase involved in cell wall biosynthesis